MTQPETVRTASALPLPDGAQGLLRWVSTNNPFYVLSAGLFLAGLWISFGGRVRDLDTWALLFGLGGYTLLLAVTAYLLVRFGNVWDDVRTVLLLLVLMFLATSVTFDEVLALHPRQGIACYLIGLLFSIGVSEALLRGTRLKLPVLYRVPYYLILALFFLYPVALNPRGADPRSEGMMWGLFGFSPVAGLVALTLLPAIRRGPGYVRDNGSPWQWPLYPWSLFAVLGLAVPARAFLLCWSLHLLPLRIADRLVFGLYFLVPFGLAIAVLLLEMGIAWASRGARRAALLLPVALIALAAIGHRPDEIYQMFLGQFTTRLGFDPLQLTLIATVFFYAYAALRGVALATEALTAALVALAAVGPETLSTGRLVWPRIELVLLAAALQLGLGLWGRSAWRCLVAGGLAAFGALSIPVDLGGTSLQGTMALHLALLTVLIVGAAFDSVFARVLRLAGAVFVLMACLAAMFGRFDGLPSWAVEVYPLVMAVFLAGYGLMLSHRPALAVAALVPSCWLMLAGWHGYHDLRQSVMGLDYLALSLALFAVAVLIGLSKSGALSRWLAARSRKVPDSTG